MDGAAHKNHANKSNSPWTAGLVDRLKQLVSEGYSWSHIAVDFGSQFSRNSIIGKMYRLGYCKPREAPREPRPRATRKRPFTPHRSNLDIPELPLTFSCEAVAFMDVQEHQCRYPLTAPFPIDDFLFCGARKIEGSSYCERHYLATTNFQKYSLAGAHKQRVDSRREYKEKLLNNEIS